jgi:hypothetical protein
LAHVVLRHDVQPGGDSHRRGADAENGTRMTLRSMLFVPADSGRKLAKGARAAPMR